MTWVLVVYLLGVDPMVEVGRVGGLASAGACQALGDETRQANPSFRLATLCIPERKKP